MFVSHRDEIEARKISGEGIQGVTKQVLIGPDQGWEDQVMRLFTVEEGGYTPKHEHPWPHSIFVVEGTGTLFVDGKDYPVKVGSVAYVTPGKKHQLRQAGEGRFVFMCIVPKEGDQ
ncbi:MAG TPA: cupin domain-containing protein [Sediminispirochaeta sp.]|nr:cupin domain-containing protein [Sediminispirochaeta sp.]